MHGAPGPPLRWRKFERRAISYRLARGNRERSSQLLLPPYNGEAQTRGQSEAIIGPAVQSSTPFFISRSVTHSSLAGRGTPVYDLQPASFAKRSGRFVRIREKKGPSNFQLRRQVWAANGGLLDPS